MPRRVVVHNHFPARDAIPEQVVRARNEALKLDKLGYHRGLKGIKLRPDTDQWNAHYDRNSEDVTVQRKFLKKGYIDMVQTFLHEFGHRGEDTDPETAKKFKTLGMAKVEYFLDMANKVHRDDYAKNGISDEEMASEAFAESYARFCLGLEMPNRIRNFWEQRSKLTV